MSPNQSRTDRSETQLRRPGRSGNSSQQRSFAGGGGKGGGTAAGVPPPSSSSLQSSPSLLNKNYKKSGNGQGAQSRMGHASLNSQSNVNVSNARNLQNGAHGQSQTHDGPSAGAPSGAVKPNEVPVTKGTKALPKAPSSQTTSGAVGSAIPGTCSKGVILQFGSISPGLVNGMQVPARTTSAPPNLDEQKRDQARHDSSKAIPTLLPTNTQMTHQLKKDAGSINRPSTVESHLPLQTKRDTQVQIPAASVGNTTQKSASVPMTGISIPMPYQQPKIPLQFGAPGAQIQSQGVAVSSLQMPMLTVGNTAQVQPQVFVSGLQSHHLQPSGMMHQGQSLGFATPIGHQLSNIGISMGPQFATLPPTKYAVSRKSIKITHPETHEELRLGPESFSDGISSGPRSHPNVLPQSQPIQAFSPSHSFNYFPTVQANSYNTTLFIPNQTSVPLSTQVTSGASAKRYNYTTSQGGSSISFINSSVTHPSLPVTKAGHVHGVSETSHIEHARDRVLTSVPAPSTSVRVTVKPAVKSPPEKVVTSATGSMPVVKVVSPKSLKQPCEASALNQESHNDGSSDGYVKDTNSVSENSDFLTLPLPISAVDVSAATVTKPDSPRGEPFKRSNSGKDQYRRQSKKEMQIPVQQHQVEASDSFGALSSSLQKIPGDNISDLNAIQESKTLENMESSEERAGEPSAVPITSNLVCGIFTSKEIVRSELVPSLECSRIGFEVLEKNSGDSHATFSDPDAKEIDGLLHGEGNTGTSLNIPGLDGAFAPEKLDGPLPKDEDGFVSADVNVTLATTMGLGHDISTICDTSLHDCCTSEAYSGSVIIEPTGEKSTEVVLQHEPIVANAVKITSAGLESVDLVEHCDSEVGKTNDSAISSDKSASCIDGMGTLSHITPTCVPENTAFTPSPRTESESAQEQECPLSRSNSLIQETFATASLTLPEMTVKHDGRGAENTRDVQTSASLLSKDKIHVEKNRVKSAPGKKKKRKEILMKADAAGTTSDLYMAYKGPEEKNETPIVMERSDSSVTDENHAQVEAQAAEDDGQSKSELDDWEDAAEIPTPKMKTSGSGDLVHGLTKQDDRGVTVKKYTRDFLLTFADQYNDLPAGFEIAADIVDALMSSVVASSHRIDRDLYASSGKIIDRPAGGSRNDRRGSGIIDDDKWGKVSGSFAPGRDARVDVIHGVMAANTRSGQMGNHGVTRNSRGQSSVQHGGGILSGSMHTLTSPGGMVRIGGDSEKWQRSKGLIPVPSTPLQVMHKAERKYEIGKISDEEEAKQRKLKSILNKLTPQNFDKLFEQVKEVNIDSAGTLSGVISQIFDKALMEPTFCEMYANFCYHLAGALPDFKEDNEKITFKRLLLNKCQEEFEKGEREQAEANEAEEGEIKQSKEEREEKKIKARRRMLGNIRLIGELYNKKMLTERIMHECIKKLLGQHQNPDEEDIEALCKLMSTIGEMIDHPKAKEHMDIYFDMMLKLSNNQRLSSRVRFMLKDAIDLRKNKWQQRRKVEGPKKIEEVHRDAAQERQLQTSRLSRSASGISSSRRGPSIDYGPRIPAAHSSSNAQQLSAPRNLIPQSRGGYGSQDVRFEDRHSHESRMLSLPLPQRPIDDDSITLGPQGGLARGMSIRGQPLIPGSSVVDVPPSGDHRRMTSSSNGYNSASDGPAYHSREEQRHLPESSLASLGNEQSSSVQRSRSLRDQVNSSDRSVSASSATVRPQGSLSGPLNVPSESKLSEDHLRNKSISAIREYYSARNEDEIRLCIRELNSPSFYPEMVMLWVTDSFERKRDTDREILAKLLVSLSKSRDCLLSQVQLIKGFETVLSMLEDAVTDSPKAAEYLGRILGKIISENAVNMREIGKMMHEGGDEQGRLLETGLASDVLASIFDFIKQDRGDAALSEMWMSSNLRLDDFRHPDPVKSKRLEAFM